MIDFIPLNVKKELEPFYIFVKKMVRYLSIFFSIVLLLSSTSFVLIIDHCTFSETTFVSLDGRSSCCCDKSVDMPNDCCNKTKIVVEKIKDNYTPSTHSNISPAQILLFVATFTESFLFGGHFSQLPSSFLSDSSPPNTPVPLSILYRSILI